MNHDYGQTLVHIQDAVLKARQRGLEETLRAFRELAEAEQKAGDGRALRLLNRYETLIRLKLDGGQ